MSADQFLVVFLALFASVVTAQEKDSSKCGDTSSNDPIGCCDIPQLVSDESLKYCVGKASNSSTPSKGNQLNRDLYFCKIFECIFVEAKFTDGKGEIHTEAWKKYFRKETAKHKDWLEPLVDICAREANDIYVDEKEECNQRYIQAAQCFVYEAAWQCPLEKFRDKPLLDLDINYIFT